MVAVAAAAAKGASLGSAGGRVLSAPTKRGGGTIQQASSGAYLPWLWKGGGGGRGAFVALLTLGGGSEKEVPKRDIHKRCSQNVSFWRKILEGGKSKKKERKKRRRLT